jgi:hypothetical protein
MRPLRIEGYTHVLGAPEDWSDADLGKCGALAVKVCLVGNLPFMISAWEPTPYELELLNKGASIHLYVQGKTHPVVSVCVGDPPK